MKDNQKEIKGKQIEIDLEKGVALVPIDKKDYLKNKEKFNLNSLGAVITFNWGDAISEEVENGK